MSLKWWEKPVRMMRRDYISDLQRMKDADLDELARSKKEDWHINCEWVIATPGIAPGLGWQVTFNTDKYPKYAALGDFDLIREYLPHARKYGLHVLAYTNMHWFSYDFAADHHGWEQVDVEGTPYGRINPLYGSGTTLCVNSGWRNWAFDLIRETMKTGLDGVFLDGPVVYPGCCYCPACQEKFQARYGVPIPPAEDWSDPHFKEFIIFREDSMAEFLRDARDAVREVNPEGVIFLNGGSWHGGGWRVARDIEKVGPFEDFNGEEAFFHPGAHRQVLYFWATAAKHLTAAGKPAIVFSHHSLGAWHYLPLVAAEAKMAAAQTVACGANPWIAIFDYAMDNAAEEAVGPISEINGFLERNEEYCTAATSCADVALLYSAQSNKFYVSGIDDLFTETVSAAERDLGVSTGSGKRVADLARRKSLCDNWQGNSYLGWFEALTREHIPFDVVLDSGLTDEKLARYSTLIVGNASCLSDVQLAAITRFAERGGNIIVEFEAGQYDELGNPRSANPLWPYLGLQSIEGAFAPATAEEYLQLEDHPTTGLPAGRWLARPVNSLKVHSNASISARFLNPIGRVYKAPQGVSEYPAMTCREAAGRYVYLPCLAAAMYGEYQIGDHQRWLGAVVRWAHNGPFPLRSDAPGSVQLELWEQPGRQLLHLVNNTGDMVRPVERILPQHDLRIWLRTAQPAAVRLVSGAEVKWEYSEGEVALTIPQLDFYDIIVVER